MNSQPDCAAIVLAAGGSTRLGQPKQLVQYEGESLLRRSVRAAVEAGCGPVVVVVGYESAQMMLEVEDLPVACVVNGEWHSGMASSIRTGVEAVMQSNPAARRGLLMVCDQPRIGASLLMELIRKAAAADASAACCSYAGVVGVPAVFARRVWPRLLALEGDEGARRVLAAAADAVTVEFSDGRIDVDTPADLVVLQATKEAGMA